ncbi:MAG TPA: serine/threonine protein kinase [Thiotrichaceae bacterium]|jgi:serine/threonine protein kinase|nr:serine/threonine protein kinase [Thiotrichaceae bacterium]HIM09120.1 serine/threonine protein kinase [Gammaproteobacteria bacterium]
MAEVPQKNKPKPLPAGYELQCYTIKGVLGQGGFGITYLAQDNQLERDVAIKEFMPRDIAERGDDFTVHSINREMSDKLEWARERFVREARTLSKFNHNNIVRVYTVIEENNTAYMVMSYEHGVSFHEKLLKDGQPSEDELKDMMLGLLDGLEVLHEARFIHRDIKPGNIFIREDGTAILLDFGSARQAIGEENMTLTKVVTPGYAPFEQYYGRSDMQGPWTDIHSLGATCYKAITGEPPMDATFRNRYTGEQAISEIWDELDKYSKKYSTFLLHAIEHSLRSNHKERPQSVSEWRAMLEDPSVSTQTQWRLTANSYNNKTSVKKSKEKKQNFYLSIAVGLSIVFIILVYIYVTYF